MEFPQPSPATSPLSPPVIDTSEDLFASTANDWETLFDFSIEKDDNVILEWDATDLLYLPSLPPPVSNKETLADPNLDTGMRKPDSRLVCANYLAGRIPCACPELDEKEKGGDEENMANGGRKRARARAASASVGVRCQVQGCEMDITELKGYHRRHRVCLRCANASLVMIDGEEKRYCQQCGKFHVQLDFDEGKRSCRRKLEKHNRRRRRNHADLIIVAEKETFSQAEQLDNAIIDADQLQGIMVDNGTRNKVMDGEMLLDCENGSGFPECSFIGPKMSPINNQSFAASDIHTGDRIDNAQSSYSSTICDKKGSYSSMCPTGRISFKLYDWNPGEFPRQLRHQIFQWLESMPVELEGYIRPGCTIFTVFIAMPHHMWEQLYQNVAFFMNKLINSPESLLLGRGNIFVHLSNMIVHVFKDGALHVKMKMNAPILHFVHPPFFDAGKAAELIACGSNLDRPKLRFLVSFAGKYLVCDARRLISHQKMSCYGTNSMVSSSNCDHEMFVINIRQTDPEVFGPAFIEVENESGISNFFPILIGEKKVCSDLAKFNSLLTLNAQEYYSDINTVGQPLKSDLVVDIAWLLRKPCSRDHNNSFMGSVNVQRLKYLIHFSMQNELINVIKAILRHVDLMIHEAGFQNSENLNSTAEFIELLECTKIAKRFLYQKILLKKNSIFNSVIHPRIIATPENMIGERRNVHISVPASNDLSIGTDASASLICSDSYLTCKYWATNNMRRWPALLLICSSVMCFFFCIIRLGSPEFKPVEKTTVH